MAAQKTDQYKKPSPGMWLAFETSLNKGVKIGSSFSFVRRRVQL